LRGTGQSLPESELALLRLRRILLALLAGLLPGLSSEREQRFAFALPEAEGRISLGVFDSTGKLRRTLYVNAAETDFTAGLNGLIATWDGKDDLGQPLPAGRYHVRGYLVPDTLKAEGVAYHFNDWVDEEKAPRITRIDDFRQQAGGFVLLAQTLDHEHPAVFRYERLRGFLWASYPGSPAAPEATTELPADSGAGYSPTSASRGESLFSPAKSHMLAATDQYAAVLLGRSLHLLNMGDGTIVTTKVERFPHALSVEASHDALFVSSAGGLARVPLPDLEPAAQVETPLAFDALAAVGDRILGASSATWEVWEATDASWNKLPLAIAASSLSFGYGGTLWMTGTNEKNGKPFTGQFDKQGEFLRSYRDEFLPLRVCASTIVEEIAVLERGEAAQRLRVLSLNEKSTPTSGEWIVDFEKIIQDCRRFGIVDGKLVPDAGDARQADQVEVALAMGGLTTSPNKLSIRVTAERTGLWLETQSGLRLAFLASQSNVRRVVVLFGPKREFLTVYAGDGAVVAEYVVRGLGKMVEIDAGEVELP
jgi:hypothetical protein